MARLLLLLLFLLLLPTQERARAAGIRLDIETVTYGPPKNTKIAYGGIIGAALDELENQLRDQASQYIKLRYDAGIYTLAQANSAFSVIGSRSPLLIGDRDLRWFEQLPVSKGGLPVGSTIIIGPNKDFLDNGLFKLDYKFGFKLKDHEIRFDKVGGKSSGGVGDPLLRDWTMRFRPTASFTSKLPLLNYIGLGIYFDYRRKGVKRIEVGFLTKYDFGERDFEVVVTLELYYP